VSKKLIPASRAAEKKGLASSEGSAHGQRSFG
jgi:hypothetical protein